MERAKRAGGERGEWLDPLTVGKLRTEKYENEFFVEEVSGDGETALTFILLQCVIIDYFYGILVKPKILLSFNHYQINSLRYLQC